MIADVGDEAEGEVAQDEIASVAARRHGARAGVGAGACGGGSAMIPIPGGVRVWLAGGGSLYTKRLERRRFPRPPSAGGVASISAARLGYLIDPWTAS